MPEEKHEGLLTLAAMRQDLDATGHIEVLQEGGLCFPAGSSGCYGSSPSPMLSVLHVRRRSPVARAAVDTMSSLA
jgi:hypothetical protein